MKITFYINGACMETFESKLSILSEEDRQCIEEITQDLVRNFGYAPTTIVEEN